MKAMPGSGAAGISILKSSVPAYPGERGWFRPPPVPTSKYRPLKARARFFSSPSGASRPWFVLPCPRRAPGLLRQPPLPPRAPSAARRGRRRRGFVHRAKPTTIVENAAVTPELQRAKATGFAPPRCAPLPRATKVEGPARARFPRSWRCEARRPCAPGHLRAKAQPCGHPMAFGGKPLGFPGSPTAPWRSIPTNHPTWA